MYDNQIRQAFHDKILSHAHDDVDTLIVDELGLQNGSYRADIAVLNGKLEGFEIKGEYDTLDRLPNQVEAYNSIFKKVSLVACDKHIDKSLNIIPDWWGVYLAYSSDSEDVSFKKIRAPKVNKNVDGYSLAQLLWKNEAVDTVHNYLGYKVSSRATREDLYKIIAEEINISLLSKVVIKELKKRREWR